MKFHPHGGSKPLTATYDTVKDSIIQYVQKEYNRGQDVAVSLRDMSLIDLQPDMPTRVLSTETDAAKAQIEQQGLDIQYEAEC